MYTPYFGHVLKYLNKSLSHRFTVKKAGRLGGGAKSLTGLQDLPAADKSSLRYDTLGVKKIISRRDAENTEK